MGREHRKRRQLKIKQTKKRQAKLTKLRKAYTNAKDSGKKEQILEKVFKLTPWLSKEEFLKVIEEKKIKTDEKSVSAKA